MKELFKRSGIHFSGTIISKLFTTGVYILLSLFVSPIEYGVATLALTLILLGNVAGDFGLVQWYQKQKDEEVAFAIFLKVRIFFSTGALFVLLFLEYFFKWLPTETAVISALILIPQAILSVSTAYLIRHRQVWKPSLQQIIQALPILAALIIVQNKIQIHQVFLAYFFGSLISVFFLFPRKRLKLLAKKTLNPIMVIKQASKYALLNYTSATYARADSLLVAHFLGSTALGFYGLAYRYLEYFALFPSSLVQILFPVAARGGQINRRSILQMTLIMALLGAVLAIIVGTLAPFIILNLHGIKYFAAVAPMRILSLALFLFFVNSPLSTTVQASDMVKRFLPFGIANTTLNILLNIIFIPTMGIIGAAWAMCITEITGLLINFYFVRKIYTAG